MTSSEAELQAQLEQVRKTLADQTEAMREMSMVARGGGWSLDLETQNLSWTEGTYHIHELDPATKPDLAGGINFYAEEGRPALTAALERAMSHGESYDLQLPFITATGRHLWVRSIGHAERRDGRTVRLYGVFQDITEAKESELALIRSAQTYRLLNERLALAADAAHFGVWDWHVESGNIEWDDTMFEIYGLPKDLPVTLAVWQNAVHPDDLPNAMAKLQVVAERHEAQSADFRIYWPDGTLRHIHAAENAVLDEAGVVTRIVGINIDVTAEKMSEELRLRLAELDSLTEVLNHRAFREAATSRLLGFAQGYAALIFFDLDAFKNLNDHLGHLRGDEALVAFADVLRASFPAESLIGRVGGDEFVVLVLGVPSQDEELLLARYVEVLAEANEAVAEGNQVAASYGVAWWDVADGPVDLEAMITVADAAMYQQKRSHSVINADP